MTGAAFEAGSISKFFSRLKPKNKPESGIQDEIKNLTPAEKKHYNKTGELPTHVQEKNAAAARVDDGTPAHPSENKTNNEKLDPTQKDVKDVSNHVPETIKKDTVSFSSKNSSTSNLSGKTAVEQPIGRTLQLKHGFDKIVKRSAEKMGLRKKEVPKSERQPTQADIEKKWGDENLSGLQQTHYNQLSSTEKNIWRTTGKPPERLQTYYDVHMRQPNFPDRELLKKHIDAMPKKEFTEAQKARFVDEKHMAANYHLSTDKAKQNVIDGYAKQVGNNKVAEHDAPIMANQPWRNSYKQDDFFNPPAHTGKAENDLSTVSGPSQALDKPSVTSKFREDLPEAEPSLVNSRRNSSSTLGGNSIKETSPHDLIGERRWSQGSTTTVGSRPSSIYEKETPSFPPETKQSRTAQWRQGFNNWLKDPTGAKAAREKHSAEVEAKLLGPKPDPVINKQGTWVSGEQHASLGKQTPEEAAYFKNAIGSDTTKDRWGTNSGGGQTGVTAGDGRFEDRNWYNAGDF